MEKDTKVMPSTSRFYQPELDALRFIAFLGVLAHHKSNPLRLHFLTTAKPWVVNLAWALHGIGAYGVELFFLLSSYLITRLLLKEVDSTGKLDLRAFYIRRTLRIWPLYFFFLILCGVLVHFGVAQVATPFWFSACFFVANWYLSHNAVWMPLILLWTLSIEEQFYVCWPILMRSGKRAVIRNVSLLTIVVSNAALIYLHVVLAGVQQAGYKTHATVVCNTFAEAQFFGLGALLALWAEKHPVALSRSKRLLLVIVGFASLLIAAMFDPEYPALSAGIFSYSIMFLLCAVGVIALFRAVVGMSARWFPAWLLFLGKISYGLYIFNLFATYFVLILLRNRIPIVMELPVVFAVNLVLAILSYYLIEKPFLRLKVRFEVVRSRPVESMPGSAAS